MTAVLETVRREMAQSSTPEEMAMMEQDMIQHFDDHYMEEHQEDLNRVLQGSQMATQMVEISDEEGFQWEP